MSGNTDTTHKLGILDKTQVLVTLTITVSPAVAGVGAVPAQEVPVEQRRRATGY